MSGLPSTGWKVFNTGSYNRDRLNKQNQVNQPPPTREQTETALDTASNTGFKIRGKLADVARQAGINPNGGRKRKQTRSKTPKKLKRKTRRAKRSSY